MIPEHARKTQVTRTDNKAMIYQLNPCSVRNGLEQGTRVCIFLCAYFWLVVRFFIKESKRTEQGVSMANEEHLKLLWRGYDVWNQWRQEYPEIKPDLSSVNLSYTNLSYTNLRHTRLNDATLRFVDLSHADLDNAHFYNTTLSRVIFAWNDLRIVEGLETVFHFDRSIVDLNTVQLPEGPTRTVFLRGVGFPDTLVEYYDSLYNSPLQFSSCFISYSHEDNVFAQRIWKNLQDKGVRCWFAPHDLRPGDYHHSRIDEAIHVHENALILLSEHSVESNWVKHEIMTARAREVKQERTVLFPVRLDNAIMETTKDWAMQLRDTRHIGDFTNWQDEKTYQEKFAELLRHLKVGLK